MRSKTRLAFVITLSSMSPLLLAQTFYGVTTDNNLVSFNASDPTQLTSKVMFSGFEQANELVLGIDFRPPTGKLLCTWKLKQALIKSIR